MKKCINGKMIEITQEEIAKDKAEAEQAEREKWVNINYDEAVNIEIRKRYSDSQEHAINRQRFEKPEEFEEYYNYCEECKAYVKLKIASYEN